MRYTYILKGCCHSFSVNTSRLFHIFQVRLKNGGGNLQKWILLVFVALLAGCSTVKYEPIDKQQSFVATVNILQPSLQFFDDAGELLAQWQLEKAYSGATLVDEDFILLYGHQLPIAHLYELSTGKLIKEIETPAGTTNSYYDAKSEQFFLANSEKNELYAFDKQGEATGSVKLRNYPMSMIAYEDQLFVVNYKDTILSVVNTATLQVEKEFPIPTSSQGLWFDERTKQLWLGGHGSGTTANDVVTILDAQTGETINELKLPLMPIAFASNGEQQAVVSHGNNMLYTIDNEQITMQQKISANPFAVNYFEDYIVVAGYDDATLYYIQDEKVIHKIETQKGPFQILTREM